MIHCHLVFRQTRQTRLKISGFAYFLGTVKKLRKQIYFIFGFLASQSLHL
jgi:hypothetical protein